MVKYLDIDGDSGVDSYDVLPDALIVHFKKGGSYLYNSQRPGALRVQQMKTLAESGDGLNAYINRHVKKDYAQKLA